MIPSSSKLTLEQRKMRTLTSHEIHHLGGCTLNEAVSHMFTAVVLAGISGACTAEIFSNKDMEGGLKWFTVGTIFMGYSAMHVLESIQSALN